MIAIDTNVLLRFVTRDDESQWLRASKFMASLSIETPGFITTVSFVEAYWVLTQRLKVGRKLAAEKLSAVALSDEVRCEDDLAVGFALSFAAKGGDFADALIAATAKRVRCSETVTFDKAAAKALGWRLL